MGRPGMGMPVAKPKDFRGALGRLVGLLRPDRWRIAFVVAMALVSVAFNVIGPKLLGNATNLLFDGVVSKQLPAGSTKDEAVAALRAAGHGQLADMVASLDLTPGVGVDFGALGHALQIVIGVYVLAAFFAWVQAYVMAGVTQRAMFALRERVDRKLGRLPLRYFDTHPRGDVLSRVTNDIDNINTTLQQTLTQTITSVATVVGVLAMMVWISPLLAVIALVAVPLSFVVTMLIARRSQPQFVAQWKWTGTLNGHVEEMYSGHDLVKIYGRREQSMRTFDEANERVYDASFKAQFVSGVIMPALNVIGNLNYVGIAVIGGFRIASGTMSLGDVQAFVQYSRQFTMPITQIASMANLVQSGVASAERVFELLDEPEEEPDSARAIENDSPATSPATRPKARGHVEFDHIAFRYEPDKPLIEDLSLEALPGQTVAIVGPTGAGKTTLVNLLMRFYELDAGEIRLDGDSIRDLTRDLLRRTFGMVLQDAWLFGGTIRENIRYGDETADDERVVAAAKAAHVDHFVRTLPDGYDTILDDDASNVSSGERQLITIARAFLADPAILILDEATSSVDTRTEVLIQQAMARLRSGRTSFVIAHRLSTIRGADVILVMDAGRVVESGNHGQLLAAEGVYHDLYLSQFSAARAAD
jgi:ATP-binding cassette, subfamily B, multidrug efflux pump